MNLNIKKYNYVRFARKHRSITFTYKINTTTTLRVRDAKYPGVMFTENLTWSKHIDYVTAKVNRVLIFILIFIYYITSGITSNTRSYAEDCVLYRDVGCDRDSVTLQEDLTKLQDWCCMWEMLLNLRKRSHMKFTRKRQVYPSQYTMEGQSLTEVKEVKHLGVTCKDDLKWNKHIHNVSSKANRTLSFLQRNYKKHH